ncbi:MAG TPA: methenyltetrahydromethanopterin cyclohydrolase [Methanospirillum sp.]|uniref:methenyltetrahydromethanopterin cyclohydrolase n=1 Tax=Methanospirillum sp. TaxID=45200 RepID=UPI002B6269B8|nr:methenyltetrahydromethanopterin cyclohydrolase [Methanospirillum sp.]HOJ97513.1 methenyltetrahydromethanopterin cyclohydrolase [Methanospirillum sp.]HPP78631.1 methenyltetrahydromethanopterin cyclohydrolase [Methanospirillum sp.]
MISVNTNALPIVLDMMRNSEILGIRVHTLENGATVIDCGVRESGCYEAGLQFLKVCAGGLIEPALVHQPIAGKVFPFVHLTVMHPIIACLGSQKAGWMIRRNRFFAMGSGPARALALKPKGTYQTIQYSDASDIAIITLESGMLPDEDICEYIAEQCGVTPSNLYALVTSTRSIVGSIQISGRIVTMAMHKLEEMGYVLSHIINAAGRSPVAPVKQTFEQAMGVTNDCNIYYGSVIISTRLYSDAFSKITSDNSEMYGRPFYELFRNANYNFVKIGSYLGFSPAELTVHDWSTGKVYHFGRLNEEVLLTSFQATYDLT